MRRTAYLLGWVLCSVSACDPPESTPDGAKAGDAKADKAKSGDAKGGDAKSGDAESGDAKESGAEAGAPRETFSACMAGCAGGEELSATDAATCRLACEQAVQGATEPVESSAAKEVLLAYDTCAESCDDVGASSNRSTCRLQCTQTAGKSAAAHDYDRDGQACAAACLDGMLSCTSKCPTGADAAATCKLQCAANGRLCISRCGPPAK